MKLFLISQTQYCNEGMYDSAIVAAPDGETARQMDPGTGELVAVWGGPYRVWCSAPEHVGVQYLGEAAPGIEQGVVCASFNAG